jgi:NADH:ubiquinone oxidoreductase subunit 3 (subunit A)
MRIIRFLGWTVLLFVCINVIAWLLVAGVTMMVDEIGAWGLFKLGMFVIVFVVCLGVAWQMSADDWGGESE